MCILKFLPFKFDLYIDKLNNLQQKLSNNIIIKVISMKWYKYKEICIRKVAVEYHNEKDVGKQ